MHTSYILHPHTELVLLKTRQLPAAFRQLWFLQRPLAGFFKGGMVLGGETILCAERGRIVGGSHLCFPALLADLFEVIGQVRRRFVADVGGDSVVLRRRLGAVMNRSLLVSV